MNWTETHQAINIRKLELLLQSAEAMVVATAGQAVNKQWQAIAEKRKKELDQVLENAPELMLS